ncbi:MAG: hypothetical protein GY851_15655, partial [bacterium]|nr:hypothetical protein [bacterium]
PGRAVETEGLTEPEAVFEGSPVTEARVVLRRPKLPPATMFASLITPPSAEILAAATTAASATVTTEATRGPAVGGEAATMLSDANASLDRGESLSAVLTAMDVLNEYGGSHESQMADTVITTVGRQIGSGELPATSFAEFEAQQPAWETLTADGRHALATFYSEVVQGAADVGNEKLAASCIQIMLKKAPRFLAENGGHYLIQTVYESYYDVVSIFGGEEAADDFIAQVETSLGLTGQDWISTSALYRLSEAIVLMKHYNEEETNPSMTFQAAAIVASYRDHETLHEVFADPYAYDWAKGQYAQHMGDALRMTHRLRDAVLWYELGAEATPGTSHMAQRLALRAAEARADLAGTDYAAAVVPYQAFLERFPEGEMVDLALTKLSAVYSRAGDYEGAEAILADVVNYFPNTDAARDAEGDMDLIFRHLHGTQEVCSPPDPLALSASQRAQVCGPRALCMYLTSRGIQTNVDSLCNAAGTDEAGTTMAGLMRASEQAGAPLDAVEADRVDELSLPFIAHVHGAHYVLVSAVTDKGLTVHDVDGLARLVSLSDFADVWQGYALVARESNQTAAVLDETAASQIKGGWSRTSTTDISGDEPDGEDIDADCPTSAGPNCDDKCGCQTQAGNPCSPQAWVGVSSPGVNPYINTFRSGQEITEVDISVPINDGARLQFIRTYKNPEGRKNQYNTHMGRGWAHQWLTHDGALELGTMTLYKSNYAKGVSPDYEGWVTTYTFHSPLTGEHSEDIHTTDGDNQVLDGGLGVTFPATYSKESSTGLTINFELIPDQGPTSISGTYDIPQSGDIETGVGGRRYYRATSAYKTEGGSLSGGGVALQYDGAGKLTAISAAAGSDLRSIVLGYDGNNRITSATLVDDATEVHEVTYMYDGNGDLVRVRRPDAKDVVYSYGNCSSDPDNTHFIDGILDIDGNLTEFDFTYAQSSGRYVATKITATLPNGLETDYERSLTSNVATITNWPDSNRTTMLSKTVNTPLSGDLSKSASIDYYTDASNYLRWTYEYTTPSALEWDKHVLTKVTAPGNRVRGEWEYDGDGRLTKERHGTTNWTTYEYTTSGNEPTKVTSPDSIETTMTYDYYGRLSTVSHPSFSGNAYDYNYYSSGGLLSEVTDPLGHETEYTYDDYGNVSTVTNGEDETTTFVYDPFGNMTSMTDGEANLTTYEYDTGGCAGCGSGGLLKKVIDASRIYYTEFFYDDNDNLTKTTSPMLQDTIYVYDSMNRVTSVTPPGSTASVTFTYDKMGRVATKQDTGGNTVSYTYNMLGRLVSVTDPVTDPDESVTFTYTDEGKLATVTDGNGNTTTHAYLDSGLLRCVQSADIQRTWYTYDAYNRLAQTAGGLLGGVQPTIYTYSATTGLLSRVRYTDADSNTYDADYTYDASGRMMRIDDWMGGNGLRYAFDDAGRLESIMDYDNDVLYYAYDDAGNVVYMNDYHGHATSYEYTATNQLSRITAPGTDKEWDFTYNANGQVTEYEHPNGMETKYWYDAQGRMNGLRHYDGSTIADGWYYTFDTTGR